jgi:hypothetical protein
MRRWAVAVVLLWAGLVDAERLRAPDGAIREVPEASVAYALNDGYQRLRKVRMRKPDNTTVDVDEDQVADATRRGLWQMTPKEVADDDNLRSATAEAEKKVNEEAWRKRQARYLIDTNGNRVFVSEENVANALSQGWHEPTSADTSRLTTEAAHEQDYGGTAGAAKAFFYAAARGLTLWLSDIFFGAIGGPTARPEIDGLREVNPRASAAGLLFGIALLLYVVVRLIRRGGRTKDDRWRRRRTLRTK